MHAKHCIAATLFASLTVLLAARGDSPASPAAPAPIAPLYGVSLCGGEFGGSNVPGKYGVQYIYPDAKEFAYFKGKGLTLIRLPFRWERVQHELNGPLDGEELHRIDAVLADAQAHGILIILDMHNYARYRKETLGTPQLPNMAFADVWGKLAAHFKDSPALWGYSIMNEPHDIAKRSPAAAQAACDAIRGVDRQHILLVCGDGWAGAFNWRKFNDTLDIHDPVPNRLLYEAHCYFDHDHSGSYKQTYDQQKAYPNLGVDQVKPFVEWLNQHHFAGFLGEYGVPGDDPRWVTVLDHFLGYLKQNQIGGTYWAAGPWWGSYRLSVEPRKGEDRPQMAALEKYGQGTGTGK